MFIVMLYEESQASPVDTRAFPTHEEAVAWAQEQMEPGYTIEEVAGMSVLTDGGYTAVIEERGTE